MRIFFVSKLKYDVIQKDGYFHVGSIGGRRGGGLCCFCFGVLSMGLYDSVEAGLNLQIAVIFHD